MNAKAFILFGGLAAAVTLTTVLGTGAHSQAGPVTFNNQVVRILQNKCQVCHRHEDIGPFSFLTYQETSLFGEVIREVAQTGEMPPWPPLEGCGQFDGVKGLTSEEIEILFQWVEQGKPEGNPADLPPPLHFDNEWHLGEPDLILEPEGQFDVLLGDDKYRCFSLPADPRGDRFVSAIDFKPGARSVVHHATLYLDESGESERLDDNDPAPGFNPPNNVQFTRFPIAWWGPGEEPRLEAPGTGWRIPRNARLVLKVHYHVHHGGTQQDRTQVGLYFTRQPIRKELRTFFVANTGFEIPAGEESFQVTATLGPLSPGQAAHALAIAPHMQLLGREVTVQAIPNVGAETCLIFIDEWDSHTQSLYHFTEPVALPGGTRLHLEAVYDNSTGNPENPNFPPRPVRHGERAEDETCLAYVKYTLDAENLGSSNPRITSVTINSSDQLVVVGKGFLAGADIEIDGERLADTRNHKKKTSKRVFSNNGWKTALVSGRQSSITVLNPDGARSVAISFSR